MCTMRDCAREAALRSNLAALRDAIDKFHADRNAYPEKLADLVEGRYLRAVPVDPVTERDDTWRVVPPPGQSSSIADVRQRGRGPGPGREALCGVVSAGRSRATCWCWP